MSHIQVVHCLECNPVIAAVQQDKFSMALSSPAQVIFHLGVDLLSVKDVVNQAHNAGKYIFIHIDLAEGIGKDRVGVRYLSECGVDGIISTKAQLIRFAKEQGLVSVQRFFTLDSKGMDSIADMIKNSNPHFIEIMPGVIAKTIKRFATGGIPVIAGGLIQTKAEVTDALGNGATAVSTGETSLWYI